MFAKNHSMGSKIVVVFTISLIFIIYQVGGKQSSTHQEWASNLVNSSIFKTIMTSYGDIFDCVDIHKQHSLYHPLLQNHTLQMSPSSIPELSGHESTEAQFKLEDGGCPEGSVPIRRHNKKDLTRFKTYLKENPSALNLDSNENSEFRFARSQTKRMSIPFEGARGKINVYNPRVSNDQHSDAFIYVTSGRFPDQNSIQAGWTVNPIVYGDKLTRLHTFWTSDSSGKTGCVNLLCKGFVQISKEIPLGIHIQPYSQCGGQQYDIPISIFHDQFSGNWWLTASKNVMVGYWPKEIFKSLANYAEEAGWGGRAFMSGGTWYPQMGSGQDPGEGIGKACFVEEMQFARSGRGSFEDLNSDMLINYYGPPKCYGLKVFTDTHSRLNILFGGPGGQCYN